MFADVLGVGSWPDVAAIAVVLATFMGAAAGFTRWVLSAIRTVIQDELRPLVERVTKLEQWKEIVDFEIGHLKETTTEHSRKFSQVVWEEEAVD